jgi:hypothetical protein
VAIGIGEVADRTNDDGARGASGESGPDTRAERQPGTEAGACYSEQEYTSWMKAAGFIEARRINLPGPSDLIVGRVR